MAGKPWEKYAAPAMGRPWEKYARQQPEQGLAPWQADPRFKQARDAMQSGSTLKNLDTAVRGGADMLSLGMADKMAAGLSAATGLGEQPGATGDYAGNLAAERVRTDEDIEQRPLARRTGQALGLAAGLKAPSLNPFGSVSMPARVGNAATTGAMYGSVAGAGQDADSLGERAWNAGKGALTGAAIGAAAYPIALGASKTWGAISSYFANRGVPKKAADIIVGQLKAAGLSPRDAMRRMMELGPEGMLADVAPGMQVATGGAAVADPTARNIIAQRLTDRTAGGKARVDETLNQTFGPPRDPYAFKAEAQGATKATDPAYELAKDYKVDLSTFSDWLTKQVQAYNGKGPIGKRLADVRDLITDSNGQLIEDGGMVHMARRQIDAMIDSARTAGEKGVIAELNKVRMGLDIPLKETVPGLIEADAARTQSYRLQEAFDMGRDMLQGGHKTMTPAQIEAEIAKRSGSRASEVDAIRQGLRTEVDRSLSNQRLDPALQTDRILSRDWNRDKAAAVVGADKIPNFERGINREATFRETARFADPRAGSPTAAREAAARDIWGVNGKGSLIGDMVAAGTAGAAIGGPAAGGAAALAIGANSLRNRIVAAMSGKAAPETIAEAADMLTATGAAREPIVQRLEDMFAKLPERENSVATIRKLLQAAITYGGVTASNRLLPQPQATGPR